MFKLFKQEEVTQAIKNTFCHKEVLKIFLLALAVFISSLAVIYTKECYRILSIKEQKLQTARDHLYTQWSQSLLEKNTWGSLPRIKYVATHELNLVVPTANNIQILDESSSTDSSVAEQKNKNGK